MLFPVFVLPNVSPIDAPIPAPANVPSGPTNEPIAAPIPPPIVVPRPFEVADTISDCLPVLRAFPILLAASQAETPTPSTPTIFPAIPAVALVMDDKADLLDNEVSIAVTASVDAAEPILDPVFSTVLSALETEPTFPTETPPLDNLLFSANAIFWSWIALVSASVAVVEVLIPSILSAQLNAPAILSNVLRVVLTKPTPALTAEKAFDKRNALAANLATALGWSAIIPKNGFNRVFTILNDSIIVSNPNEPNDLTDLKKLTISGALCAISFDTLVIPVDNLFKKSFMVFGTDFRSNALAKAVVIVLKPFSADTPILVNSSATFGSETHLDIPA